MKGMVTITNLDGGIIFSANIWTMVFINLFHGPATISLNKIRVFIDDEEIQRPEEYGGEE